KTGVPEEKPLGVKERANNKLNLHMLTTPGFEPGPHWWGSESSHHCTTLFLKRHSRLKMKIKKASCSQKTQIKKEKSKENQEVFTFRGAGKLCFGIRNRAQKIRNSAIIVIRNPSSLTDNLLSITLNLESTSWNPDFMIVLDSLTRGDW
ncbi:unnamed protein product, partial [Porites evermanni]